MNTEILWKEFSSKLRNYVRRKVSNPSLVDDILQDIFIKIHLNSDKIGESPNISGWIYTIARNTVIDHYKKKKLDSIQLDDESTGKEKEECDASCDIAYGLKDMAERLPALYREALSLYEFEGLSFIELSKKLGISVSGAKSRVQRARAMLKDILMNCCHFSFDKYGTIIDYHPITCCCCKKHKFSE